MAAKTITLYRYQIELLNECVQEEQYRLYNADIIDGRLDRLRDQEEELEKHLDKAGNEEIEVIVVEERPIADAIMNEMYTNTRTLVEDGPHAMGDLGELARLYREIFGQGPEQSIVPRNEKTWSQP